VFSCNLNRGEAHYELVGRCLFFANRDEFRERRWEFITDRGVSS
jgi:hypothetical protein